MNAAAPRALASFTGRTWAALAALAVLEGLCGLVVFLAVRSVL